MAEPIYRAAEKYGSGKFRPLREWNCPNHDYPASHICDCEYCTQPDLPPCCRKSGYVQVYEDGRPVYVEEGMFNAMLRDVYLQPVKEQLEREVVFLRQLDVNRDKPVVPET